MGSSGFTLGRLVHGLWSTTGTEHADRSQRRREAQLQEDDKFAALCKTHLPTRHPAFLRSVRLQLCPSFTKIASALGVQTGILDLASHADMQQKGGSLITQSVPEENHLCFVEFASADETPLHLGLGDLSSSLLSDVGRPSASAPSILRLISLPSLPTLVKPKIF